MTAALMVVAALLGVSMLMPVLAHAAAPEQSSALVGRINEFRTSDGLPALASDDLVAQAALNHSEYWTQNTGPSSPHEETAGNPGYTGQFPSQRCQAVGTTCGTEVMATANGTAAVDLLMGTVYHRHALLDPTADAAGGAGVTDGWTTIDLRGTLANDVLSTPVGFPFGNWQGPLTLAGESPDPVYYCNAQSSAPPIAYPVGLPVTWELPVSGRALGVIVTNVATGTVLSGCTDFQQGVFGNYFLPAGPLEPTTTYRVDLTWATAASTGSGPPQTASWQFTTPAAPPPPPAPVTFPTSVGPKPTSLTIPTGTFRTPPPTDTTAPTATLGGAAQKPGKTISLNVSCVDEPCTAKAVASVRVPAVGRTGAKTYKLGTVRTTIAKRQKITIALPLPRAARTAIKRALRAGRRVVVAVKLTVTDVAGNNRLLTRRVRIKG